MLREILKHLGEIRAHHGMVEVPGQLKRKPNPKAAAALKRGATMARLATTPMVLPNNDTSTHSSNGTLQVTDFENNDTVLRSAVVAFAPRA